MFYLASENVIRIYSAKLFFYSRNEYLTDALNYSLEHKNGDFIRD